MKLSTSAQVTIVTRMVGSVRHIGWIGKWDGITPAVSLAFTKLVGLGTESATSGRSGVIRNDERRYADADEHGRPPC